MMTHPAPITDKTGRQFKTLRVSLTNICNLSCTYCTSGKTRFSDHAYVDHVLLKETILQLHKILNFSIIRFTGGEPLLYPDLIPLIKSIHKETDNISVKMTTNGYLLARKVAALAEAGLKDINISLDAIHQDIFYEITKRKNLSKVFRGIEAAKQQGIKVKINSVIMKGINEQEIVPLFDYGFKNQIPVRYLELMKMGYLYHQYKTHFFSLQEILSVLKSAGIEGTALGRKSHGTARYWQMTDGYQFGIIANETAPFCKDCDRLRLDSRGNIYGCLSSNQPVHILPFLDDDNRMAGCLQQALSQKKTTFTGSTLSMMEVGG